MAQHDCAVSLPSVEIFNCDVDCRSVISLLVLVGLVHVVKAGEFGFVSSLLTARLLDHRLMEVTGTNLLKSQQLSWSYNDNCQETKVGSLNRLQIIQDGYIDKAVYKLEGYVEGNTAEQMQLCLNGKPSGVRVQPLEFLHFHIVSIYKK